MKVKRREHGDARKILQSKPFIQMADNVVDREIDALCVRCLRVLPRFFRDSQDLASPFRSGR
jgi:hypothetical protein